MKELPVSVRRSIELVGLYTCGLILIAGNGIIAPIIMAFLVSIVVYPLYSFFVKKRLPESLAIALSLTILIAVVGGVVWFFSSQVARLISDFPTIKENVTVHLNSLSEWINRKTHFSTEKQVSFINDQSKKLLNYAGGILGGAATSVTSIFIFVGLIPIYVFLILFYKNLLLRFIFLWFPPESHEKVKDGMHQTQAIIKSYLVGLLIQISYITVLLGG